LTNTTITQLLVLLLSTTSLLLATSGVSSGQGISDKNSPEQNAEQLAVIMGLEADIEYGEYLAGECLTCHAPTAASTGIPVIHGKQKDYLASAILEYKLRQRENNVMQGVTAALSNEEVAALATYFSSQ